jgi:3-oxo-5-alpha-steroid 4-dehydrogenase 1
LDIINFLKNININNIETFNIALYTFIAIGLIIFIVLFFKTAPYGGRHTATTWGMLISSRTGWLFMEIPASLLFTIYFIMSPDKSNLVLIVFFIIWQSHYFHRAFIFPFYIKSHSKMPILVAIMGLTFNSANTYIQGAWLFLFAPGNTYTNAWLTSPQFIIGTIIFYSGYIINKNADSILKELREKSDNGYEIPYGGLYSFISCPNYFGEIIEWIGWAVLTWSFAGAAFAFWTIANLAPRALANHKWYLSHFNNYPKKRKALIPYLF